MSLLPAKDVLEANMIAMDLYSDPVLGVPFDIIDGYRLEETDWSEWTQWVGWVLAHGGEYARFDRARAIFSKENALELSKEFIALMRQSRVLVDAVKEQFEPCDHKIHPYAGPQKSITEYLLAHTTDYFIRTVPRVSDLSMDDARDIVVESLGSRMIGLVHPQVAHLDKRYRTGEGILDAVRDYFSTPPARRTHDF